MKIFRCPVHDVIDLSTGNKDVDRLIIDLIDSREFQRLKKIKQLGFAHFAYPGAEHSRFLHSLGVAFIAKEFLDKIISLEGQTLAFFSSNADMRKFYDKVVDFFEQTKKDKPLTIVAALLHDIGHGAFSHLSEDITGVRHEEWVKEIILGDTEVNSILTGHGPDCPQKVCDILFSSKIISGKIDIDKMDYLLRDSHITGSGYGKYDIKWLYNILTVGIYKGEVTIGLDEGKGIGAAEQFVTARIDMFRYVYLHKTTLVAQKMLEKLIERLKILRGDGRHYVKNKNLENILFAPKIDVKSQLKCYLAVKDSTYDDLFESLLDSDDEILRVLAAGLLYRRLFKKVEAKDLADPKDFLAFKIEMEPYKDKFAYDPTKDEIILFDKNGRASELSKKSATVSSLIKITIKNSDTVYKKEFFC